jgi:transposase
VSKQKRTFTKEFREEAVKMVVQDGLSQSEVGRRLGLGSSLISGWIQAAKKDGAEAFRGRGNVTAEAAELRKLQQENKELKDEVAFLKKSALYFASLKK